MGHRLMVKLNTRVSLVVSPVDDYTAESRSGGNIHVFLSNHPRLPIRKKDGYYVFTDLPEGTYEVSVQSDVYLDERFTVELDKMNPADPVVFISLKPNSAYPFPAGATLIRAALRDSQDQPIQGVEAKAIVLSSGCARAKPIQEGLKKGSRKVCLVNVAGKVAVGDMFFIQEKEEVRSEYCKITGILGDKPCFEVAEVLQYNHSRGALLLPVIKTRTDRNGEVVLYFRNIKANEFEIKIEFSYEGRSVSKELKLTEGKMHYLGLIQM